MNFCPKSAYGVICLRFVTQITVSRKKKQIIKIEKIHTKNVKKGCRFCIRIVSMVENEESTNIRCAEETASKKTERRLSEKMAASLQSNFD